MSLLGQLEMTVPIPSADIIPVAALFNLDENGIIHLSVAQLATDARCASIIAYAIANDGKLNVADIQPLIASGQVPVKTIHITKSKVSV